MKYFLEWKQSWLDLFKNLKLLIPDVLFLIFEGLLAFVLVWLSGLFPIIKTIYFEKDFSAVTNNLARVIVAGGIFIATSFVFGAGIRAVKYNFIKDVVKKKKVNLGKFFEYSGKDILRVILVRILLFLIITMTTGVLSLLGFISKSFLLLIPVAVIIYSLGVLFVYPIMFLKDKKVVDSVKLSFSYFKENLGHVLLVWIIVTFTGVIISYIIGLFDYIPIVVPLNVIVGLFVGVWSLIYLFKAL